MADMDEVLPGAANDTISNVDAEIEEMQRKVAEMDEEAEKLKKLTDAAEEQGGDPEEVDKRSVYVGNVDYGTTPEELQEHFKACGHTNRITILIDKFTGHPKGFAYIEFADEQTVQNSLLLNGSLFRGRQLKVTQKRTNIPGWNVKGKSSKGKSSKGKGKGKGKGGGYGKGAGGWMWVDSGYDSWGWDYGYAPVKGYKGGGKGYAPY
mmetsp:Transcript_58931/g.140670  ORF Transcript_58931/g.140670 Transcript_58931/m.140670 type:complete len:207 (-) Transcript_58931:66-686(-)|eukprot:CAMPEP_0178423268 /NCGR_PEP_ID=MMETSP0689_2-20121128/27600_1 /TAXON_ID=160604 /ORGANISM="Amphidinium massartii, Strain CS-259" /LENGTH=206 /DNA_ID=CAMNT_0020044855 /DNA_START=40 /DNA_END=660 /DNA_ORIENTATION=+